MSNPVLKEEVFNGKNNTSDGLGLEKAMSSRGTLNKTLFLGLLLAITASYTWYLMNTGFMDKAILLSSVGVIGGLITCLIISFGPKNNLLPISTSIYAMFEGLFLGSTSAIFNKYYPGIVTEAVLGTILTVIGMYLLYASRIIKATPTFKKVVIISTFSILGIYIIESLLNFLHVGSLGIFSNSIVGIIASIVIVAIAALNLVLDYDFIDNFSGRVPDYFEWYGGFALMVTIVWLYIEILRLLAKINSRN